MNSQGQSRVWGAGEGVEDGLSELHGIASFPFSTLMKIEMILAKKNLICLNAMTLDINLQSLGGSVMSALLSH